MHGVQEVLELATGQIKHLSWREYVSDVLSDGANDVIGKEFNFVDKEFGYSPKSWEMQFAKNESKALADNVLEDTVNQKTLNATVLAGQSLGSAIGQTVGSEINQAKQKAQQRRHEKEKYEKWLAKQLKRDLALREPH